MVIPTKSFARHATRYTFFRGLYIWFPYIQIICPSCLACTPFGPFRPSWCHLVPITFFSPHRIVEARAIELRITFLDNPSGTVQAPCTRFISCKQFRTVTSMVAVKHIGKNNTYIMKILFNICFLTEKQQIQKHFSIVRVKSLGLLTIKITNLLNTMSQWHTYDFVKLYADRFKPHCYSNPSFSKS